MRLNLSVGYFIVAICVKQWDILDCPTFRQCESHFAPSVLKWHWNPGTVWICGGCCYVYLQVVLIGTMQGEIVEITYIYIFATMLHELHEHPSFLYTAKDDAYHGLIDRLCLIFEHIFLPLCFRFITFDNNQFITRFIYISCCQRLLLYSIEYINTSIESTRVDWESVVFLKRSMLTLIQDQQIHQEVLSTVSHLFKSIEVYLPTDKWQEHHLL